MSDLCESRHFTLIYILASRHLDFEESFTGTMLGPTTKRSTSKPINGWTLPMQTKKAGRLPSLYPYYNKICGSRNRGDSCGKATCVTSIFCMSTFGINLNIFLSQLD